MKILLVQPAYYTRYPPLGLLKLAAMHKDKGDEVAFVRGLGHAEVRPNVIYVTSLFTYAWKHVHDTVAYYKTLYPRAKVVLGGIYATLMPEHARLSGAREVHTGLVAEAEGYRPDYSLVPEWDSSIMFSMRGCIRKCAFCAVPRLEGKTSGKAQSVRDLIKPGHKKAILWDNNVLGVPNWSDVVDELKAAGVSVDFNQGLDARLITDDIARKLREVRVNPVRLAYDIPSERNAVQSAIESLHAAGFSRRRIIVYTLYNFTDTPDQFWGRVTDLLSWGSVSYPMRYEPLNSLIKNRYVSPHWTAEQLELVAAARRVIGAGGAFPPYQALIDKLTQAGSFEDAFSLRGTSRRAKIGIAGTIEDPTPNLSPKRRAFRDLFNDPATLQSAVHCAECAACLAPGDRAFAIQDYVGRYVAYLCPLCHPNKKWINGLWRSTLGGEFEFSGEESPLTIPVLASTVH